MVENKLLLNTTIEEFVEALRQGLGLALNSEDANTLGEQPQKHYVYGLKGLCALLGCSLSTAARIKKSGTLDAAISQQGKIIVVDADLALEILKVQKKHYKPVRGGYRQ
jgi:hypothetical protein